MKVRLQMKRSKPKAASNVRVNRIDNDGVGITTKSYDMYVTEQNEILCFTITHASGLSIVLSEAEFIRGVTNDQEGEVMQFLIARHACPQKLDRLLGG